MQQALFLWGWPAVGAAGGFLVFMGLLALFLQTIPYAVRLVPPGTQVCVEMDAPWYNVRRDWYPLARWYAAKWMPPGTMCGEIGTPWRVGMRWE